MNYHIKVKKENGSIFGYIVVFLIYTVFYAICVGLLLIYLKNFRIIVSMAIVGYFILMIVPMLVFPMWCLTDSSIVVFQPVGILQKWKYVLTRKPVLEINFSEISRICVSYEKVSTQYIYQEAYNILFDIYLKNGDIICFDSMFNNNKKNYLLAIDYIESKGIKFVDKFSILSTMKSNDKSILYNHLREIEVNKND